MQLLFAAVGWVVHMNRMHRHGYMVLLVLAAMTQHAACTCCSLHAAVYVAEACPETDAGDHEGGYCYLNAEYV
jgi:hypothetical protein